MAEIVFVTLNDQFYIHNAMKEELLQCKNGRPFFCALKCGGKFLLVPLRTNLLIKARYGIKTGFLVPKDSKPNAGLDYTKIVIVEGSYIEGAERIINNNQRRTISENINTIKEEVLKYLNGYVEYKNNNTNHFLYQFCTLKYFHEELGLENGTDARRVRNDDLTR